MSSTVRFAIFVSVALLVLAGANAWVFRQAAAAFQLREQARRRLGVVMAIGLVAVVIGRMWGRTSPSAVATAMATGGLMIQLAVLIAFVLLIPVTLMLTARRGVTAVMGRAVPSGAESESGAETESDTESESESGAETEAESESEAETGAELGLALSRRDFVGRAAAGSAVTIGAASAGYGTLFGRHDYVIEEVPIAIDPWPKALEGFTIVQLSDIHVGTFVGDPELRSAVELVRRAKPDLVVLTGDLIDHDPSFAPRLGQLVRELGAVAPVAAIPGNHDYYAGIGETIHTLKRAGADVLVNRGMVIGDRNPKGGQFALLGVDDVWARRMTRHFANPRGPDVKKAIQSVPGDLARVLLCHNPAYFPEAAPHVDLQLSGHTHGGQVNLGLRPADIVLPYGYVEGRYTRGPSQLYVNRGFGTAGPPARIGAPPEVTKLILTG